MLSSSNIHLKLLCEITRLCAYAQYIWIQERLNNLIHDDAGDEGKSWVHRYKMKMKGNKLFQPFPTKETQYFILTADTIHLHMFLV
jgi:hypothetical protein